MSEEQKQQHLDEEKNSLQQGVIVSFALHAFIVSVFTLKAVFFTETPIDFSSAIRVDIVGLPDKLDPNTVLPPKSDESKASTPPKSQPEESAANEPAPVTAKPAEAKKELPKKSEKESINLEKTKAQQNAALNKLKALSALEKIKQDVQKEKSQTSGNSQTAENIVVKGNVINPGTSLTGLEKIQHESYLSDLDRHIKQNWSLPEWLAQQDLKAQVHVQIDKNGMLVAKKLLRSSGNSMYDDYAMETIEKSIPFPKPPEKFSAIMEVKGIIVGFPE
ncbi:MAG: TonB family protein [Bdellovibrionia bacterium]